MNTHTDTYTCTFIHIYTYTYIHTHLPQARDLVRLLDLSLPPDPRKLLLEGKNLGAVVYVVCSVW